MRTDCFVLSDICDCPSLSIIRSSFGTLLLTFCLFFDCLFSAILVELSFSLIFPSLLAAAGIQGNKCVLSKLIINPLV